MFFCFPFSFYIQHWKFYIPHLYCNVKLTLMGLRPKFPARPLIVDAYFGQLSNFSGLVESRSAKIVQLGIFRVVALIV